VVLSATLVFIPIPLSNVVPALVIALISLAYLEEDALHRHMPFPIRLQRFQKLGHDACCSHETDVPVHFAKVQTHLISPAP
jgi:hypothetical protein